MIWFTADFSHLFFICTAIPLGIFIYNSHLNFADGIANGNIGERQRQETANKTAIPI